MCYNSYYDVQVKLICTEVCGEPLMWMMCLRWCFNRAPQFGLVSICAGVERRGWGRKTSSNPHTLIFMHTFAEGVFSYAFMNIRRLSSFFFFFFLSLERYPEEGNLPSNILHLCRLFWARPRIWEAQMVQSCAWATFRMCRLIPH